MLADWAAIAIENARLYATWPPAATSSSAPCAGCEATAAIARAIGGETDLDRVLELIVKRGRALVEARASLILLRDGDELVVAAGAGHVADGDGARLPLAGSTAGQVLAEGRPRRIADAVARAADRRPSSSALGHAATALLVPLVYRGQRLGVLAAFDRLDGDGASRATTSSCWRPSPPARRPPSPPRSGRGRPLRRRSLAAAERERRRWARELHDETLQGLGGLRVLLSSAARRDDPEAMRARHARGDASS